MKVKELIAFLEGFNPDLEVMTTPTDPNFIDYVEVERVAMYKEPFSKEVVVVV